MKKNLILIGYIMFASIIVAQIPSQIFESGNAIKEFPILKNVEKKSILLKKMPQIDVKRLLEEEKETKYHAGPTGEITSVSPTYPFSEYCTYVGTLSLWSLTTK